MTKDEALDLALDALKASKHGHLDHAWADEAITAIKQARSAPVQEPTATVTSESGNPDVTMSWWHEPALPVGTKLYTTPPAAQRLEAAILAEREACAKVCEEYADDVRTGVTCAKAIRNRGNT